MGKLGIDKVLQISRGVFIVRLHDMENRNRVVDDGVQMFDKKTVIVKPWKPDMNYSKTQMEKIHVWVRLSGLDIKYWGKSALTKIAGLVRQSLKANSATTQRERLTYARVLVETALNQVYSTSIIFKNEYGKVVVQTVTYKWKPVLCDKYGNYGHEIKECGKFLKEEKGKQEKIEVNKDQQGQGKTSEISNGLEKTTEVVNKMPVEKRENHNKQTTGKQVN